MKLRERQGEGLSEIRGEHGMYELGKTEDNRDAKELDCVTDFKTNSE